MLPLAITALAAVSALIHVRAEYRGPRRLVYAFKPLTTTLLLALALALRPGASGRYQAAVAVGLALSLAGDVFLMLPRDRFVAGLASFLAAHLAYVVAFSTEIGLGAAPLLLVPAALPGAVVLALLWPTLGRLRAPVAIYVATITVMAWQAAARAWTLRTGAAALALLGAACFVASDAMLALDRFRAPFRSARALVMATYVTAQWLIAMSVAAP